MKVTPPCSLHRRSPVEASIRIGSNGPNASLYRVTLTEFRQDWETLTPASHALYAKTISFFDTAKSSYHEIASFVFQINVFEREKLIFTPCDATCVTRVCQEISVKYLN